MTFIGANTHQLSSLARSLQGQIDTLDQIVSTVTAALAATQWTGPARDRFEHDWNTAFRGALTRMQQAFEAAGNDCQRLSTDLEHLLGRR